MSRNDMNARTDWYRAAKALFEIHEVADVWIVTMGHEISVRVEDSEGKAEEARDKMAWHVGQCMSQAYDAGVAEGRKLRTLPRVTARPIEQPEDE